MKISFLGQGYEPESTNAVGNRLKSLFANACFNKFFCLSAFTSKAGVAFLEECINSSKIRKESVSVIVGIDQEGTSKDALIKLNSVGLNSYIFYQKEPPIFHPKIYLFEGDNNSALIIGSSNLTAQGLFTNVESSLLIEFENSDKDGSKLISELKNYYSALFNFSDSNLFRLSETVIETFVSMGVVPSQNVWKQRYHKSNSDESTHNENCGLEIPRRFTAKVPKVLNNRTCKDDVLSDVVDETDGLSHELSFIEHNGFKLLWNSHELTQRDLNIPTGSNTNPTGSMLFKKADYEIDQRHYFKEVIFSDLTWTPDPKPSLSHLLRAECKFRVIILGLDYGTYNLKLSHNSKTDTPTYRQNNAMTQIHWGDIKTLVANNNLLGKKFYLLKDSRDNSYVIEIK